MNKRGVLLAIAVGAVALAYRDQLVMAWSINQGAIRAVRASVVSADLSDISTQLSTAADREADAVRERRLYFWGVVALSRGDYPRAKSALNEAIRLDPADHLAQFGAGSAAEGLGAHEEALRRWSAADATDYFVRLGERSVAAGDLAAAKRDYDIAVALRPNLRTLVDRGLVYAASGDWNEALGSYERAALYDPRAAEPLVRSAILLQDELGRPIEAITLLQQAIQREPTYDMWAYIRVGNFYRDQGDASTAAAWYTAARAAFPGNPEPDLRLGDLASK